MIKIFDSMTGKKKLLRKPLFQPLKIFVCGPTVYGHTHIGNARTYIAFDVIVRYLRYRGFKIVYLQNITDMDDKIIEVARKESITPIEVARKYENIYHEDEKSLDIISITKYARATDHISEIIAQIQKLVKKGKVYKLDDGYYFDIKSFPDYGKLARRTVVQAEDGVSRIDDNPAKRNKGDFAVWKLAHANSAPSAAGEAENTNIRPAEPLGQVLTQITDKEPIWETELGPGRPGWHIEDTAITEKFFGPRYDIHGGGIDLKFPHHEAEIAIEESVSGKRPLAKIWMHAGLVSLNGGKMSKSLGNIITTREFIKNHSANTLRFLTIQSHYRSRCEFGEETAQNAEKALYSTCLFLRKLELIIAVPKSTMPLKIKLLGKIKKARTVFRNAMDDDFNTPRALGVLFEFMNVLNKIIWRFSQTQARLVKDFIEEKMDILGIKIPKSEIPEKIKKLVGERELYRSNKQFGKSDSLRKQIEALGYLVEDTPLGPLVLGKL
jgi:cysteinyl-tRNA synthetase